MKDRRCWRCSKQLCEVAPKDEDVIIRCPRCKASNVIRRGTQSRELDSLKVVAAP